MKSKISFLAIICLSFFISINSYAQGVGINPSGAAPDNSAMLDVSSANKGFLLPRVALVSATDPIASPVEGLLVYNDGGSIGPNGFYYFDGTGWKPLASGSSSNGHYIGEVFGGGIVFFVDSTGQHGLMASLADLDGGSGVEWSNVHADSSGAYSMTDGSANTDSILYNTTTSAALLCRNHNGGGHNDWYLPANRELILLFSNDIIIDHVLDNDGDSNTHGFLQETIGPDYTNSAYWSSTDDGTTDAWAFICPINYSTIFFKANPARVRAIRAF
jgi:hypothetical protein